MGRCCSGKLLAGFAGLLLILCVVHGVWAGYAIDASYESGTKVLTYHVYVESGSPPPFRDFHILVDDGSRARYQPLAMPAGWGMSVYFEQDGPPYVWVSFFGESACTEAVFRLKYTGPYPIVNMSRWRLSDDGDLDATTGIIAGEGGNGVPGPWHIGYNTNAKVAVHVMPHAARTCTDEFPVIADCSDIVASCPANDIDFFPVFYDLASFKGFEYSVDWPGTYSCAFTSCSDLTIGSIVFPAGTVPYWDGTDRVAHAWGTCQLDHIAVPGWGWICEPGPATITIVASSGSGYLQIGDCDQAWNEPVSNFNAGMGGAAGQLPCGPAPVDGTTWGSIKRMFK